MFDALVLRESEAGILAVVEALSLDDLPAEGEILVHIPYSSLNYKDALAVSGAGKVVRAPYPFVPGIDLVGQIIQSSSSRFSEGDWVIATGGGLGETRWGGYSGRQWIADQWLVALPAELSPEGSMALGTAGLTAMLSLIALESQGQTPEMGTVLVTGATGGVGSFAVRMLSHAGYHVTAATGKSDQADYLKRLGASEIMDRSILGCGAKRDLDSAKWAGAIDTAGGPTLAAILSQTGRYGNVAACGLADAAGLQTSVFPFILRGVNLLGIDSNTCPVRDREQAWERMAATINADLLEGISTRISLQSIPDTARKLLNGRHTGRTVVQTGALSE